MIMRCIQKDSQLAGNASKSDARVNQVSTRQKESDAMRENGCHFCIHLELDLFRNSMLKELVDTYFTIIKFRKIDRIKKKFVNFFLKKFGIFLHFSTFKF